MSLAGHACQRALRADRHPARAQRHGLQRRQRQHPGLQPQGADAGIGGHRRPRRGRQGHRHHPHHRRVPGRGAAPAEQRRRAQRDRRALSPEVAASHASVGELLALLRRHDEAVDALARAVGFAAGITATPEDYVLTARLLASRPELLAACRRNLRADMARSSLCDHPGHARALEEAYRAVWRIWCAQG